MSEAPRRMASSISLLTKRTIGASSTSSRRDLVVELVVAAGDFEALEVDAFVVAPRLGIWRVDLLDGLVDGLLQLVVFDDDGFDAEAGLELDLVDRVQVGRIGDRRGTGACRAGTAAARDAWRAACR